MVVSWWIMFFFFALYILFRMSQQLPCLIIASFFHASEIIPLDIIA